MIARRYIVALIGLAAFFSVLYLPRVTSSIAGQVRRHRLLARVTFDQQEIYVGSVPRNGPPVECMFYFTNSTRAPVQVVDVKTSCGCVNTGFTKESVAPGARGFVNLRFSPEGRQGTTRLDAAVLFRDANIAPVRLCMQVNVHEPLFINPPVVSLGDFDKRTGGRGRTVLINKTDRPFTVRVSPSEKGYVEVTMQDKTIQPGRVAELEVLTTRRVPEGEWKDTVSVDTDANLFPHQTVTISGTAHPGSIVSRTGIVELGFISRGGTATRTVTLVSLDGRPFKIVKAWCGGVDGTCEYDSKSKADHVIKLQMTGDRYSLGRMSGKVSIIATQDGQQSQCDVPVNGYVTEGQR